MPPCQHSLALLLHHRNRHEESDRVENQDLEIDVDGRMNGITNSEKPPTKTMMLQLPKLIHFVPKLSKFYKMAIKIELMV